MKWQVLVSAPYMLPVLDEYRGALEQQGVNVVAAEVEERLSEEELLPLIGDIDGVICGDDQFSLRVMQEAPKLKVISKWGTGIDSIDSDAAQRLGIRVCNTPGAFTDPVADTVMGYILMFARSLGWLDREMRAGRWAKRPGISLRECTLGVVGLGDVGGAVVQRAAPFGMRILGTDIRDVPMSGLEHTGLEIVSQNQLLEQADYVSLNCTLNPTSHHLIGPAELARMKNTAYLINTCRGPVVDQQALVEALQAGAIAGAALDVFEDEPLSPDSPLRAMENCLMAPHNANSSPAAWKRVHENTINNLLAGLQDGKRS